MSYSTSIQAANKSEAKSKLAEAIAKIAEQQTIHARDHAAIAANATACIDLLDDDANKDVSVSINGSVGWSQSVASADDYATVPLTSASISCGAYLVARVNTGEPGGVTSTEV